MAKCLISHLLCAVLCLLCCAGISIAAVVQHVPQKGERTWQVYTVADTDEKIGGNWRPIRIALFADAFDEVLQTCKRKWAIAEQTGREPALNGAYKVLCDKVNGISDTKRVLLLEKLLPDAIKLHRDRLSIQRQEGDAVVSARTIKSLPRTCGGTVVQKQERNSFPNADFVFFVNIAASWTPTRVCSEERNKRPTSALITFVPKDIVDTRHFVRTAAHEMAHGLGFVGTRLQALNLIIYGVASGRGDVPAVKSKIMGEKVVAHYRCVRDHVTEMYMESESGSKDLSHWERRIAKDELMSPYTGEPSGMYYTALTLAAFHSMEFYSANFSMAEPMSWGNDSGCDLITNTCTKGMKELEKYTGIFCSEKEPVLQCTSDRFSLGMCSAHSELGELSEVYHHFENPASPGKGELTNGCPIIKPFMETSCETGNETLMPGSIVSKISRCLDVKDPMFTNAPEGRVKVKGICANVKCENGKVKVQYKGNEGGDNSKWHECENTGASIPLEGLVFKSGNIVCPKYEEVCTGLPETAPYTMNYEEVVVPERDVKEAEEQNTGTGESKHGVQTTDDDPTVDIPPSGGPTPNGPPAGGPTPNGPTADNRTTGGLTPNGPTPNGPPAGGPTPNGPTPNGPPAGGPTPNGPPAGGPTPNGPTAEDHTADDKKNSHTNSSIAVSLFGPLLLLVCALAAAVAP